MNKKNIFLFLALLLGFLNVYPQNQLPVDKIANELKNPSSKKVLVAVHRADWRNFPENSIEGIKSAIEMGVDMVEIDVSKTKDGKLVLMHDKTIDRTTTGKGNVSDWTLDSLKTLFLRSGHGQPSRFKIPTLEEAMLTAKGKVLVNLDKCYDYFPEAYKILMETNTIGQTVIKAQKPYETVNKEFGAYLDKVIFMPIIDLDKPDAAKLVDGYLKNYKPVAFEFIFKKEESATPEILNKVTKNGSKVWINSLWASLNGGHDDDLAVQKDKDSTYGWILSKKATIIQTDRPILLLNYLKEKKLHK